MPFNEIVRAGNALYERHRATLEKNHWGWHVKFNVSTGEFVIGESAIDTGDSFVAKYGKVPSWARRIGELDRI